MQRTVCLVAISLALAAMPALAQPAPPPGPAPEAAQERDDRAERDDRDDRDDDDDEQGEGDDRDDEDDDDRRGARLPWSTVVTLVGELQQKGYSEIGEVEVAERHIEVEARNADGKRVEVEVHQDGRITTD